MDAQVHPVVYRLPGLAVVDEGPIGVPSGTQVHADVFRCHRVDVGSPTVLY